MWSLQGMGRPMGAAFTERLAEGGTVRQGVGWAADHGNGRMGWRHATVWRRAMGWQKPRAVVRAATSPPAAPRFERRWETALGRPPRNFLSAAGFPPQPTADGAADGLAPSTHPMPTATTFGGVGSARVGGLLREAVAHHNPAATLWFFAQRVLGRGLLAVPSGAAPTANARTLLGTCGLGYVLRGALVLYSALVVGRHVWLSAAAHAVWRGRAALHPGEVLNSVRIGQSV